MKKLAEYIDNWYVATLKPNSADLAQRNLTRQGFEVFLPREIETKRRGSKFVEVARPLFPGYVFVALGMQGADIRKVNSTYGVARLVSFGNAPVPVPSGLVSELMNRCDENGLLQPPAQLQSGDQVILTSGPFAQFVATVEKLTPDKRVWVLLDLLGSQTKVLASREYLRHAVRN